MVVVVVVVAAVDVRDIAFRDVVVAVFFSVAVTIIAERQLCLLLLLLQPQQPT